MKHLKTLTLIGAVLMTLTNDPTPAQAAELQIEVTQVGTGTVAENGMQVQVHYTGTLQDGTVFDSSRNRGEPLAFVLGEGRVIKGWEQGIAGMRVGEKRILTIPPELGYGAQGAGGVIPPNATLVFDVELMGAVAAPKLTEIGVDDMIAAQKNGALIIDIRRSEEWVETGILEGAKTITAFTETGGLNPDFQAKFFELIPSPDTEVILYCRTGNRTNMLGQALVQQVGLTNVKHLEPGIVGWTQSGQSTVPYSGE
jgi:rhodanese-related sulfurtransferase